MTDSSPTCLRKKKHAVGQMICSSIHIHHIDSDLVIWEALQYPSSLCKTTFLGQSSIEKYGMMVKISLSNKYKK